MLKNRLNVYTIGLLLMFGIFASKSVSAFVANDSLLIEQTSSGESVVSTKKSGKNPKLAAALSAVLPGAGQVYNGQWYKVPIIYGLGATVWYFYDMNKKEYDTYEKEYKYRLHGDTAAFNPKYLFYPDNAIQAQRDYYRRNTELTLILGGLLYALNIIDAVVFAHLSTFDVSDNLSLKIDPYALPSYAYDRPMRVDAGLKLTFTFK